MVGGMMKFNLIKVMFIKEVLEQRNSGDILDVNISIPPDENVGEIKLCVYLLNTRVKT